MRTKEQSKSIALLAEFEGEKIQGKTIAVLSYRIDGLIRLAVSEERHRCHDATRRGFNDAIGTILEMKSSHDASSPEQEITMNIREKRKLVAGRVLVVLGEEVICNQCGATAKTMNEACTADLLDPCPGLRRWDEVQVPIEREVFQLSLKS